MKTLILGDTHGRGVWEYILKKEKPDKVIFLGDYWDSHDINFENQMTNFTNIIKFKKKFKNDVVLLIGNHDLQYHRYFLISGESYSGFQATKAPFIKQIFEDEEKLFQMAHQEGEYLFTHAGVGEQWLRDNKYFESMNIVEFINDLWHFTPKAFGFRGNDPYGDSYESSPVWIRPRALMKGNSYLKKKYIQIVGHTVQSSIDIEGKATGGRYFFVDTLGTSQQYLMIEDGKIKMGNV